MGRGVAVGGNQTIVLVGTGVEVGTSVAVGVTGVGVSSIGWMRISAHPDSDSRIRLKTKKMDIFVLRIPDRSNLLIIFIALETKKHYRKFQKKWHCGCRVTAPNSSDERR
jgi:hypothetical protein